MKTNFAYIDDVMDRAVEAMVAAPKLTDADRQIAKQSGQKLVAGFRVHDEKVEKATLDAMVQARTNDIEKFQDHRLRLRKDLQRVGVTPLAVLPRGAWYRICRAAKLYVMSPDSEGRVRLSRPGLQGFMQEAPYTPDVADSFVAANWPLFLEAVMPGFVEACSSNDVLAQLILPDPPKEVTEILIKASARKLMVAAVGEAIRFAQKPSELLKANSHPKDAWAREQGYADYADWLKRDPIIFTESGPAVAVIAQFGDFPIEQAIVDAVVSTGDVIGDGPAETESVRLMPSASVIDAYVTEMSHVVRARSLLDILTGDQRTEYLRLVAAGVLAPGPREAAEQQAQQIVDSAQRIGRGSSN